MRNSEFLCSLVETPPGCQGGVLGTSSGKEAMRQTTWRNDTSTLAGETKVVEDGGMTVNKRHHFCVQQMFGVKTVQR